MNQSDVVIEVQGLCKAFRGTVALDGLTLSAPEARVLGLLGPNGAGKTTLVRILATLLLPDSGRATVGGIDVRRHPVAVRRMIGLAGQYAAVDGTLTGRENLTMIARLYRLSARQARERVDEALERLALEDAADRLVRTYSGGMRRRLDVGASLVGRPRVLLLDEPSTGLDPSARAELWQFLRGLVHDGTTILLTTQQLEEADRLADAITIIDRGAVIAEGTPAQLKARVGHETVEVTLDTPSRMPEAVAALAPLAVEPIEQDPIRSTISLQTRADGGCLPTAVRLLDDAGIAINDIAVRRPSLDDVFLTLIDKAAGTVMPAEPQTTGPPPPTATRSRSPLASPTHS